VLKLLIHGSIVEVLYDMNNVSLMPPGHWQSEKVKIHDLSKTEKDIRAIVQYLYSEGFIQDRRVAVELVEKEE
tara:strand:+ start:21 stop:239 length:219 start_codon:yes stop_codon:yes gene_type:complete